MKRTPLRRVGAKTHRERPALDAAREIVRARVYCQAGGLSDLEGLPVCGPRFGLPYLWNVHPGDHAHHVWPEDRDRGVHDPDRMLYLCPTAHGWTHDHPLAAKALGLMRPETP